MKERRGERVSERRERVRESNERDEREERVRKREEENLIKCGNWAPNYWREMV